MKRTINYLSPTSLMLFNEDPDEFYCRYVSVNPLPKEPQTAPMAIGSAFDARVKAYLFKQLFDNDRLEELFEAQVDPINYDIAFNDSIPIFDQYLRNGSLAALLGEMEGGEHVAFEEGVKKEIGGVPFYGKPDLTFVTASGARVVFDWKVNGFYSKTGHSPKPHYTTIWPGGGEYKYFVEGNFYGIKMNKGVLLENVDGIWATQLSIYSWLLGVGVADPFLAALDQLVFKPWNSKQRGEHSLIESSDGPKAMRVAQHRYVIGREFRDSLFKQATEVWETINSDHFFRYMTKEESQEHEKELTEVGIGGLAEMEREL